MNMITGMKESEMSNYLYLSLLTFFQPNMLHISNIDCFINIMIMQTEREGCNYLQVPAQYSIHTYTKDSLPKRYAGGNLQLKIVSTGTCTRTSREWRVLTGI